MKKKKKFANQLIHSFATGPWGNSGGSSGDNKPKQPAKAIQEKGKNFFEELKKKKGEFGGKFLKDDGNKSLIILAIIVIAFLWLISGLHEVDAGEQGVVLRFGAYDRFELPGLRYHLPYPIEKAIIVPVEKVNTENIGYGQSKNVRKFFANNQNNKDASAEKKTIAVQEGSMLTFNRNIVIVPFAVNWKIKDAYSFLFNTKDPINTIRSVAESSMREIIAQSKFIDVIAQGKEKIADDAKNLMQKILDDYKTGIQITQVNLTDVQPPEEVKEAMDDVNGAIQDRNKAIEQAKAYRNDIIPRARGQAQQVIEDAKAYYEKVKANAGGDSERFRQIYNEYRKNPEVTKRRLYIDAMEQIFTGSEKLILDKKGAGGVVPFLPLNNFDNFNKTTTIPK